MKKITILGGSGFIGSNISTLLSNKGYRVTIFDLKKSKWLLPNQKMIIGNASKVKDLSKAIKGADIVYNFAALSDLNEAIKKPIETVLNNILCTVNALKIAHKYKVKRFIHASTIYANSEEGSFYRCSKRSAEDYVEEFYSTFGLKYTILRFGSLYGDHSDYSNGIKAIIKNAILKRKIIYEGSKKAVRRYIHVKDAAEACVKILQKKFENKYITITGKTAYKVRNFLNEISKILTIKKNKIIFLNKTGNGHYVVKPTNFKPRIGKNFYFKKQKTTTPELRKLIKEVKQEFKT